MIKLAKRIIVKFYKRYLNKKWKIENADQFLLSIFIQDYKTYSIFESYKAHKYGFTVDNWRLMELNPIKAKAYLNDATYFGLHPINGSYSKWIDDKLTLKYLCAGTEIGKNLPEYYFQIGKDGMIFPLSDSNVTNVKCSYMDIVELLFQKKELAIKQISGSIGEGFYKAEYIDDNFYVNGKKTSIEEFKNFISCLRNYIVLEYLHPHKELSKICSNTVNTMRYLAGRVDGKLTLLKSYIRFGTISSGFVENYNAGGVLCYVDKNGNYSGGNIISNGKNKKITHHPDSNQLLVGKIPFWDNIEEIVGQFGNIFPQLNYLGFDFVVTDNERVIILEINSLTSLDGIQLNGSILNDHIGKKFFSVQLKNM